MSIVRPKESYGGFLPLELNKGKEWFADYEENLMRFNSVKASLAYVIDAIRVTKIQIPYYYCPSTTQAIKDMGIEVFFFHVDEDLLPVGVLDEENTAILIVDYFGVRQKEVELFSEKIQNAYVLLDYAHDFFARPIVKSKVWNIYSAKKFFGIPDGSYVVASDLVKESQQASKSYAYAAYLIKTYEEGTNAAYQEKKQADSLIAKKYDSMSSLARGLLCNVNYEAVRSVRVQNYDMLVAAFDDRNRVKVPESVAAYHYPLYLPVKGKEIKNKLIEHKIFVSTLWGGDLKKYGSGFEKSFADNTILLPMDQRYDAKDMEYIIEMMEELI